MKKAILIGFSTLLTVSASLPAYSQTKSDPLFQDYDCSAPGCAGDLIRVLLMTATEGAFVWGLANEAAKGGATGMLLKEVEATRAAVLAAEIQVFEAKATISESERARRINSIRSDLAKLKAAADIGDRVTVNVSQYAADGMSADITQTKQIKAIESRNAYLTQSMRISPANLKSQLQEQITANLEEIRRINGQSILSLTSSYSGASSIEKVDIYSKDLKPAIDEMEKRLRHAESLPILNQQQIDAQVQKAQATLASAKANVGNVLARKVTAGSLRVVSAVGGVILLADAGTRIMFYLGGKDPFMSPVVKLSGAAIDNFRK